MPIYEYRCETCQQIFEYLLYKTESEEAVVCPKCGEKRVQRVLSPTGIMGTSCSKVSKGFS